MTAPALGARTSAAGSATLAERVAGEQRALRRKATVSLVLIAAAVLLVATVVAALLLDGGRWMSMPRVVPALAWLLGGAIAAGIVITLRRRYDTVLPTPSLAETIEQEQSLRAGSLRGALEIAGTGGVFGAKAASDLARQLRPESLAPKLGHRLSIVVLQTAVLALVGAGALAWAARTKPDGFAAAVHPVRAFRGTLLPALGFDRIPASVPRGMPVTIGVRAEGRRTVVVSRRTAGEPWRDTTLTVSPDSGLVRLALGPVRAPITVRVSDGRAPEAEATIAVADRGWIGDVALFANYPSYLGRTDGSLEPVPPLRVPRGTRVRVSATLRGGARDAALTNGTDTVRFAAAGASGEGAPVTASLVLDRDGRWTWIAGATPRADGETLPPELPDALAFTVVADRAPEVLIRAPRTDTAVSTTGVVPIIVTASDDHGVRSVSLSVWRESADGTAGRRERIEVADPASPVFEGGATIALDGRALQPGDRVYVAALATDDSPWSQTTQSPAIVLRVPSVSEQREMARDLADSIAERAAQLAAEERKLQQATSDASRNRELKGGRNDAAQPNGSSKSDGESKSKMSFSAAERAKQLAQQQQQLGAKVDSLRRSAKELEERLKGAGALDTALAARMRDVQKMLREAMTPEMQKQLAELEKNTDRLSGTEAQQSLEQLSAQQKQMRDQLEKSAEMLKRAALEGAMSTLRDEAKDLAQAQQNMADRAAGKRTPSGEKGETDPKTLADRSRELEKDVERLSQRLDEAGAKPGAQQTKAAQPMVNQAAEAMQKAAQQSQQGQSQAGQREQGQQAQQQQQQQSASDKAQQDAISRALQGLKDEKDQTAQAAAQKQGQQQQGQQGQKPPPGQQGSEGPKQPGQQPTMGDKGAQTAGNQKDGGQQGQQGGQQGMPQGQQQGGQQQGGQQGGQQGAGQQGQQAQKAADAMSKAADQLAAAREAQVDAWKGELSDKLDQSINETMQLARQQQELEQRARQQGSSQGMQGEQGAVQQGVQQAAERLEQAGRSSSLLSQRSQKAMAEAQRRVQQATQATGQAGQPGGQEAAQNAMKDASEALNQALSSLVRDRERMNDAQSASGFTEMMEQLKQLAQQQGSLNGQMQGLQLMPGGANGQQARQQSRVLARQQREVARSLQDVSDADQTGRTDALAKEAQALASQIERNGVVDPATAARQQQLYRRLLDAGRMLEQDERDDQGPREAKSGGAAGRAVDGPASGRAGNRFAPPTWNELRGLGPEERRLVIEYFRRLNGTTP